MSLTSGNLIARTSVSRSFRPSAIGLGFPHARGQAVANMLRAKRSRAGDYGCCDHCARGKALHMKPGPRERHQARAIEKRQWKKEADRDS